MSRAVRLGLVVKRFLRDDAAQDVVEYAYLAFFVSLAGAAIWASVVGLLGERYAEYMDLDDGVQSLWEPPDPTPPEP